MGVLDWVYAYFRNAASNSKRHVRWIIRARCLYDALFAYGAFIRRRWRISHRSWVQRWRSRTCVVSARSDVRSVSTNVRTQISCTTVDEKTGVTERFWTVRRILTIARLMGRTHSIFATAILNYRELSNVIPRAFARVIGMIVDTLEIEAMDLTINAVRPVVAY